MDDLNRELKGGKFLGLTKFQFVAIMISLLIVMTVVLGVTSLKQIHNNNALVAELAEQSMINATAVTALCAQKESLEDSIALTTEVLRSHPGEDQIVYPGFNVPIDRSFLIASRDRQKDTLESYRKLNCDGQ